MTNYEFYELVKEKLDDMASVRGLSDTEINKYYGLTDRYCEFYTDPHLSEIGKVFAQIAFHAQNGTMISSIIKFNVNYNKMKVITYNFNPSAFLAVYGGQDGVDKLVSAFKSQGFKWDSSKSKEKNKDGIVKRYSTTLISAANYLSEKPDREAILNELRGWLPPDRDYSVLIKKFRKEMKAGFGVPLACDFIKEFDEEFSDLIKPDAHLVDVMNAFRNFNYGKNDKTKLQLVSDVQEMVKDINRELVSRDEGEITAYQLDRMIWLICSDNFYLHQTGSLKSDFINIIR